MADDILAVVRQLEAGLIAEGATRAVLERQLAARYGFADAIVVGSGCQALLLAMRLRGIKTGARVALPTYVCPEVLGVVEEIGAEPILADICENYMLDPSDQVFQGDTVDCLLIPSLFGISTAMDPYVKLSGSLIADWAQFAPEQPKKEACQRPDVAIVSFEATKFIAGGEGGAILVKNPEHAVALRSMKFLSDSQFKLNLYPMSDLQAALVLSQLKKLDSFMSRRRAIAARYDAFFQTLSQIKRISSASPGTPFRYVFRLKGLAQSLDEVISAFGNHGVAARRPVAVMLHQVRPTDRSFPVADRLFAETLSLPLYPALTDDEVDRVINVAQRVLC